MNTTSKYSSIAEFVLSDEFDKRVRRVSAKSRPFDNSSTSAQIYAELERLAKASEAESKVKSKAKSRTTNA